MKIELEFATDGVFKYSLGYVIIAENANDEETLNIIRDMHFFGDVKYAGVARTDDNNVNKVMFEQPIIIRRCLEGDLKGTVCKEHAKGINCAKNDYFPNLSLKQFREVVKSQFEITD